MNKKRVITTEILENVVKKTITDRISIKELMDAMDAGGFGLIMTIFSLPIIIPLPPPLPSLIAFPLIIFSLQMVIGCDSPRLPKIISSKSIKRTILAAIVEKSSPYIKKAESIVRPRMLFLSSEFFVRIIGIFCFIFALSILMPVPLSNLIPGIGILIASFGLLGKDGILILLGITVGCFGVIITLATFILGVEAVYIIKDLILKLILE